MNTWIRAVAALTFVPALVFGQAGSGSKPRTITVEEARDLVYALLASSGCTKVKCDVDRFQDEYFPQFYFFEGLWPNPVGSPHIGSWAVDPKTGDLWDAVVCAEYRNSRVSRVQVLLRRRLGLTAESYLKLKARPPMCDSGEKVEVRSRN